MTFDSARQEVNCWPASAALDDFDKGCFRIWHSPGRITPNFTVFHKELNRAGAWKSRSLSPPFPRELINNQVQQIQTLTDQLNEFKHYESLFSDPKAVLLTTVQPLVNDLRKTELGQRLTTLDAGRRHALQRQGAVHEHRHDVHHSKWTNGHAIGSAISAGRRSSERLQILLHGGIEGFAENQAATALCRWESPFA